MTPLCFANPSPPSGWIGDFHPQAIEHAGHTTRPWADGPRIKSGHDERVWEQTRLSQSGKRTVATACAAIPSPRPVKPSLSVVVALTLTRDAAMSRIEATRSTIAARCG